MSFVRMKTIQTLPHMKFIRKDDDYYYFSYWNKINAVKNCQYFVYKDCLYEVWADVPPDFELDLSKGIINDKGVNEISGLFERVIHAKRLMAHCPESIDKWVHSAT